MPHRKSIAIGERGKTSYTTKCVICGVNVQISGYILRDFEGYPLNRAAQRLDFTFPDGSAKQGILCNSCSDNVRNKVKLVKKGETWVWNK